jgi:hypothetical protein
MRGIEGSRHLGFQAVVQSVEATEKRCQLSSATDPNGDCPVTQMRLHNEVDFDFTVELDKLN